MKYPHEHLSLEDKIALQEQCERRPKAEGLSFKQYAEVPVDKIVQKIGDKLHNQARSEGLDWEKVTEFENRIKEGRYKFTYEQPVVIKLPDGTYFLVTGEHRFQSHKGLGIKTMFCSVVEFASQADLLIFQSNENDEETEFIQNVRTSSDVVLTLCNLYDHGDIKDIQDDKELNLFLGKLRQKTKDYPTLRNNFRKKYGVASAVTSYDAEGRAEWCSKYAPDIDFTTTEPDENGIVYLNKTFKGGKGKGGLRDLDYDPRAFFDACEIIMRNPKVKKVVIVASLNKADSDKIPKMRKYKEEEMISEWQKRVRELALLMGLVEGQEKGIDPSDMIEFRWLPQISGKEDFTKFVSNEEETE